MLSIQKFRNELFKEKSNASLALFRILVGSVLFCQTLWFISTDFIFNNILQPAILFKFYYFQFLDPFPPTIMKLLMFLMLASTVFIIIGRFFKYASFFYGLSFTYLWLLDKANFNNHYYFISLLILLLFFTNAERGGTLRKREDLSNGTVPYWQMFILKFQIFIVFFIAGLNKINDSWLLDYQPMKHILETKATTSGYIWLNSELLFAFFSWSGMLFDISIGFLIWASKTRKYAIIFYILFNFINFWLFYDIGEIGFSPFLLLACLSIFFDPKEIEKRLPWLFSTQNKDHQPEKINLKEKFIFIVLLSFMTIQLIIPYRHILYNNHVDWTGKGPRFSWRMKIMYKNTEMKFHLIEEGNQVKREVNVGHFLTQKQYTNLLYYPDLIPQVASYIKKEGIRRGMVNPQVTADFSVGFMGNKQQYLFHPNLDLSQIKQHPFKNSMWILPLKK